MLLILFISNVFSQNPKISKVEPPNWWADHSINPVRLMVRGENLQDAKVTSANKSLQISNLKVNKNATYLFFDVMIATDTKPAKYEFDVITQYGKTKIPFEISLPLKTDIQTITNDDVVYLIMTDRFANGDTSNDKNVDRSNPRMWHGGDFRGIIAKIPYLKELGVTAIWLTPWYDNLDEPITCDKPWCPMSSYHGYGAIDFYGVENHFGTFADLQEMIRECHKNGIKVVQDQIANHFSYKHDWMKNPPLENWVTPFEQNRFNNTTLLSPYGSPTEVNNTINGWFDFSLPDFNYSEPEVAKYNIQNALWWIGMTGVNGIRQDTIQYMPRTFIKEWSGAILKQYPNYYLVGEVLVTDSAQTAFFQGGKTGWDGIDTKLPSVFDFKLWNTSQDVFTGKKPMSALRDVLKYDGLYGNPQLVTTVQGNHDVDRFMSLNGATKEGAKLHVAYMLATRGIPQLYYGDEILMTGGHDPDNRKDFSGGWQEDKTDKFRKNGRTADEQEMFEWTQKWIEIRQNHLEIQEGNTIDLYYDNEIYVFMRHKMIIDPPRAKTVFAFNHSEKIREIELENPWGAKHLINLVNNQEFTVQKDKMKIKLLPKSAMVLTYR